MNKFLAVLLSSTLLSGHLARATEGDIADLNKPISSASAVVRHTGASSHSIIKEVSAAHQKFDTGQARTELLKSITSLKAIGKSAATEHAAITKDCSILEKEQEALSKEASITAYSNTVNSNMSYQRLTDHRNQLRTHLTKALTVLKSASECEQIADTVLATSEKLTNEIDNLYRAYTTLREQSSYNINLYNDLCERSVNKLKGKVSTLANDKQEMENRLKKAQSKKKESDSVIQEFKIDEVKNKFQEKQNSMDIQRLELERERDREAVAFLLGNILYDLKRQKDDADDADLEKFKSYSIQNMVVEANRLISKPIINLINKNKKP